MEGFGERLRDSMIAACVTNVQVAKMRGVSKITVGNWLEMKDATLSGVHLASLGVALRVSISWLALGIGTPVPTGMSEARNAHELM